MKLLILSMSSDGLIDFRIDDKYNYTARIDTAYYPYIRANWVRNPGKVINFIKQRGSIWKSQKDNETVLENG